MMPTLKELRTSTGIRPGAFAKIAGISYKTLYNIESKGKSGASPEYFAKVKIALFKELTKLNIPFNPNEIEDPTPTPKKSQK